MKWIFAFAIIGCVLKDCFLKNIERIRAIWLRKCLLLKFMFLIINSIFYIFFSIFLLQRIMIFLLRYMGGVLGTALLETLFSPDGHCTTAYYRHGTQRRMSYWGGYQKSYPKTVLSYFVSPYTTQTSFLIIYLYFCLVYVLVKRIFRKKSRLKYL